MLVRPYEQRAGELMATYTTELEQYQKEDHEELLMGSAGGAVTRIKVS